MFWLINNATKMMFILCYLLQITIYYIYQKAHSVIYYVYLSHLFIELQIITKHT